MQLSFVLLASILSAQLSMPVLAASSYSSASSAVASAGVGCSPLLGLISAALFAGAALVITFAEHPARMRLDDAAVLKEFASSYRAAAKMQASLAVVSCVSGLVAWYDGGSALLLLAALSMGANMPFTLIVIMPTNKRLLRIEAAQAAGEKPDLSQVRRMLELWGSLHAVRTVLACAATIMYAMALA